jgi:hypothetical protein
LVLQSLGRKFEKPDLASNPDPCLLLVYLADGQARVSQQRFEVNACLAQPFARQTRRHAHRRPAVKKDVPWPDASRPDFDRFPDDRSGLVVRMECPAELGKKKQINVSE